MTGPPRPLLAVLPAVAVVGVPALYSVGEALVTSLGGGSAGGPIGTAGYARVASTPGLPTAALFSLWVAAASTLLAGALGVGLVWVWVTRPARSRRVELWLLRVTFGLPHLAWAVALLLTLSQSGWLARCAAAAGLIEAPEQFPVLVQDPAGIGIIIHLASKEFAFVALAVLPLASRRAAAAVRVAASLGARPSQQLRLVFLPTVAPALLPATAAVFAFSLGTYEPPTVLGAQSPRTLAVIALDRFRAADLVGRADAFVLSMLLALTVAVVVALGAVLRGTVGRAGLAGGGWTP